MGTIKVPGIGPVQSKWVIAGGALVAGIVGYAYWKQSQQATDEALSATDATTADYTTDQGSGYGAVFGTDYAYDGSSPGYYSPTYSYPPTTSTSVQTPPVTNLDWSSQAVEYLQAQGIDSQMASLATSKYLLRDCLTASQADVVRMAVGRFGIPPQSQDLRIIQCATPPTVPPSTPGALTAVNGLRGTWYKEHVSLDWQPVPGADGYSISVNGSHKTTVNYSQYVLWGLHRNTAYRIGVAPVNVDATGPGTADTTGPVRTIAGRTKK